MDPGTLNLLFLGALFAVFYFFMIRPQAKKQKEQSKFVDAVQKGDEVVTSSGIVGRITKIEDKVVQLQIDQKGFITVTRGSINKEMTDAYHQA